MGLDQLRLLRSQHKMARLLLVAALCLASVKAAVIPVEEIVDNLQSFLTAPEESGLRLKRSTGEWDKEFDLSSMGILFQLKVDAIVWKSFAGQKYGFTLTNDKFTLLAGKH